MFSNLSAMLKKNFLMFFRSKVSSILILLIPLLVVLAAGFAFNSSSLSNVYVGVNVNSSSNVTSAIISNFEQNGFLVKNFSSSESCVNAVKTNAVQICGVFSKESSGNSSRGLVDFYVDSSKINLANTLVKNAENTVYKESNLQGKFFVQDLINLVDSAKSTLSSTTPSMKSVASKMSQNQNALSGILVPTSQFDAVLSYLNNAKSSSNDSSVSTQITNAINLVNSIKSQNQNLSIQLKNLSSSQANAGGELASGAQNLSNLESLINSKKMGSAEDIVSPVAINVKSLNQNTNNRNYIIPILLALITLFGAILLSSTFVLKEKKTLAHFRNFMTPTKEMVFIFAIYLTCMAILAFQLALVFLGVNFVLGMSMPVSLELVVLLLVSMSAFIFIGMFIGYSFRSEESVIFASMTAASVFMFFSNIILPLESLSGKLIGWSFLNPLILLDSALKKVIVFKLGFHYIIFELIALGAFVVLFTILSYFARRITRRMI